MSSASSSDSSGLLGLLAHAGGGEMGIDEVANPGLRGLVHARCGAPPRDEKLLPASRFGRKGKAIVEQRDQARHARRVAGVAKPGPDAPPREEPEDALVVGRSAARARLARERVEQRAILGGGPLAAVAEDAFELAQKVLGLAAPRVGNGLSVRALEGGERRFERTGRRRARGGRRS
jgi:hypothetical protein